MLTQQSKGPLPQLTSAPGVTSPSPSGGKVSRRSATEPLRVTIVAAIAAIWALGVLSLLFTLPHEVLSPADADGDAISGLSEQ